MFCNRHKQLFVLLPCTFFTLFVAQASCTAASDAESSDDSAPAPGIHFEPVELGEPLVTFGWNEIDPEHALTTVETTYGAGVLGNVGGVAEGPDGAVYVLDRSWQKIAVFEADGTYSRIILGGFGAGPGEFQVPRGLSISADGTVGVLDEVPPRVTLFRPDGSLENVVTLEARLPLDLALGDDSAWVLHASRRSGLHSLVRYDLETGETLETAGLADEEIAAWMGHGESGAIGLLGGDVIWALARTGLIRRIGRGTDQTTGQVVFPNVVPRNAPTDSGIPVHWVAEGTHGIAVGGDTVAIIHRVMSGPVGEWTNEFLLTLLDTTLSDPRYFSFGKRVVWTAGFTISRDGKHMYLTFADPYPRIEKHPLPR